MDPYTILGLNRSATKEEAKAKFRTMAKTCHPDLHPNDPEAEKRFKEINEAYENIKDGNDGQQDYRTPGFNPFGAAGFGAGAFFHFEDIFTDMRARRNTDLHLECRLTMEEIYTGKTLNVQMPSRQGDSRVVQVTIPAGIRHGMRITVPKGGNQHNTSVPPGDLYMTVNGLPHTRFTRDNGNGLITTLSVTAFDVLLGNTIEVVDIEGKSIEVNIPAKFDSSQKVRIAGQGMPDPFTKTRGDLLVDLFVVYPELTEDQRNLIGQAAVFSKSK